MPWVFFFFVFVKEISRTINFLEAMAIRFLALFQVLIIYSTFLHIMLPQNPCNASNVPKLKQCGFDAIYNLGTSISDTGNSAIDKSFNLASQVSLWKNH